MATKYQKQDIRRTGKVTLRQGDAPGARVRQSGRRRGMVQILVLLSIISGLAIFDGVQRRNRLQQEGRGSAAGEVVEKRGPAADEPGSAHELVLRLAFPKGESVVLSTEVDPDTWASLTTGDGVRVRYAPGPEVGTLKILAIEPETTQAPAKGTLTDTPPPGPAS